MSNDKVMASNQAMEAGRKIYIFSTQSQQKKEITTSARTWGELKTQMNVLDISYSNMKAVLKEGRHVLELDNAELPEGGCTVYLYPQQVKSGASYEWELLGYNDIRKYASERGISGTGSVQDIKVRLERWEKGKSQTNDAASGRTILPKEQYKATSPSTTVATPSKSKKKAATPTATHTPVLDTPVSEDPILKEISARHKRLAERMGETVSEITALKTIISDQISIMTELSAEATAISEQMAALNTTGTLTPSVSKPKAIAASYREPDMDELIEESKSIAKGLNGIRQ